MINTKLLTLWVFMTISSLMVAQVPSTVYGLARTNTPDYQVFLATIVPETGVVTNISPISLSPFINLTGAALDPYQNLYHYMAADTFKSVDLTTGLTVYSAQVTDGLGFSYFDNFRFNQSDSTLYGLTRTITYDSITFEVTSEMFLATIDPTTAIISRISPSSIGEGFALAGSAIDPFMMVYYYSTGSALIGLDMYTGGVYSTSPFLLPDEAVMLDNFSYSCVDTALYGLMRSNYVTPVFDSLIMDTVEIIDSTGIHLAKINPISGVITIISPYAIASGGYSLNGSSTIDPELRIYYYHTGEAIVGVSMETGLIVSNAVITNEDAEYFDMMRIQNDCYGVVPMRLDPALTITNPALAQKIRIYPNPATDVVQVNYSGSIISVEFMQYDGRVISRFQPAAIADGIPVQHMEAGMYLVRCVTPEGVFVQPIVIL